MASVGSFGALSTLAVGVFGELAVEVLVLAVFFISFTAGRRLWQKRGPRSGGAATKLKVLEHEASQGEPPPRRRTAGQGQVEPAPAGRDDPRAARGYQGTLPGRRRLPGAAPRAHEEEMLRHLEQREFTRALNVYRSLERDGRDWAFSEELYSSFIQSAVRVGKMDVVDRMLRAMKRAGMPLSLDFWQSMMRMLSSRKLFSICLSAHSIFGELIPADKIVYSCLINAALEVGAPEQAAAMLPRYSEANLEPKDHVLFFRTFVALGNVDAAEAIFRKLGSQASSLMLNLLLLACTNANQPERAVLILHDAHELESGLKERIVDVVSYNTTIKGFAQAGSLNDCLRCFHAMVKQGLEPDDITLSTLLDACITETDSDAARSIVNLLVSTERGKDSVVSTLFIKGLVRAGCLSKALELYQEMKAREGAPPDIATYSVMIKALVDQHSLETALSLLEDLRAAGHAPDDIILTHLLEGCRHAGNHELGKQLFTEMVGSSVKPSEFTLVTMIKLQGRCGAHKEAYDLVAGWKHQHGMEPSVIHYTCLMSGCLRTKCYDQAWAAYQLMLSNGVAPDETSVSTLLPGMAAAQQWGHVLQLVETAMRSVPPVQIPTEILNSTLSQMLAATPPCKGAGQLRSLMQGAGIPVTARRARRPAA